MSPFTDDDTRYARESVFTDEHLKRLKESSLLLELDDNTVLTGKELQALLARLEASEAANNHTLECTTECCEGIRPLFERWFRAKGENV